MEGREERRGCSAKYFLRTFLLTSIPISSRICDMTASSSPSSSSNKESNVSSTACTCVWGEEGGEGEERE